MEAGRKPRITMMDDDGKMIEIPYESLPEPDPIAFKLAHYFAKVRISPHAINQASKIIPQSFAIQHGGLHALLQKRADQVFATLAANQTVGMYGTNKLRYTFDFDKDGPFLKSVSI